MISIVPIITTAFTSRVHTKHTGREPAYLLIALWQNRWQGSSGIYFQFDHGFAAVLSGASRPAAPEIHLINILERKK